MVGSGGCWTGLDLDWTWKGAGWCLPGGTSVHGSLTVGPMDWMDHGKSVVTFVLSSKNCYDLSKKKNCYGDIVGSYEVVAFADTSLALFF